MVQISRFTHDFDLKKKRKVKNDSPTTEGTPLHSTRAGDTHPDAEHVVGQPRSFVYDVLHADADRGQYPAQFRDPAGPVAQRRVELDQSAVDGQPSVQTPAQHRRVDVAAAQQQNDSGETRATRPVRSISKARRPGDTRVIRSRSKPIYPTPAEKTKKTIERSSGYVQERCTGEGGQKRSWFFTCISLFAYLVETRTVRGVNGNSVDERGKRNTSADGRCL